MSATKKLEKINALSLLVNCKQHDDGFEFSFIANEKVLRVIKESIDVGVPFSSFSIDDLSVEFGSIKSKIGSQVIVLLLTEQLRNEDLNIYWDWDKLFEYKPNITLVPNNFFILSDRTIHPREPVSSKVKHYHDVCKIINLLISRSDHTLSLTNTIVKEVIFLHKCRIEIPIDFTAKVLDEGLDGISIVNALFEDLSHKEQKTSILKEVIYSLLSNVSKAERLQYLLSHFGEFSKRLNENYQLFVSEFSFDDVRKEYEESKRDYFTKLNDVFSSVQTKMLGIPISLALASLKMSSIVDDISFWTNFLLALSVVIYSSMMIMLIKNQKHTLNAVKNDYESQMSRLKHQYEQIKDIQEDLNKRYDFQKICLNWFYVVTACLFFLVLALFFWNLNSQWNSVLDVAYNNYLLALNFISDLIDNLASYKST